MSRRRLLKRLALGGAGLAVAHRFDVFQTVGRWLDPSRSNVGLVLCPSYEELHLKKALERVLDSGGLPPLGGLRVVLKPNFVDHFEGRPVETDTRLIVAAVELLRRRGAREVVVAEGPGNRNDPSPVLESSGLASLLRQLRAPFVDLNYDDLDRIGTRDVREMETPSLLPELLLPRTVTRADLVISMPKLKTHHHTGVTLSLKNFFGCMPGVHYGWPKNLLHWNGIDRSILEIYGTLRSHVTTFCIIDGIVGMEGDGPLHGSGRHAGVLIAGADLPAADAVAARVMGLDPLRIPHLAAAEALGLGRVSERRIDLAGDAPPRGRPFQVIEAFRGLQLGP